MDVLDKYRQIVQNILANYVDIKYAETYITKQFLTTLLIDI